MPAKTKTAPGATGTAFAPETGCNRSTSDALNKELKMQNQTTQGCKSPTPDGIDVVDVRVVAASQAEGVAPFTRADGTPAVDVDASQVFSDPAHLDELAAALLRAAAWLRSPGMEALR